MKSSSAQPPWLRNLAFLGGLLIAVSAFASFFLADRPFQAPQHQPDEAISKVVAQVDAAMMDAWAESGKQPAPAASDLLVARRLSLALAGAVPSYEEIRAFESYREADRIDWWISHLFEDDRYPDYFAERFTRILVGVENGPFLVYRRRRFRTWLGEQFVNNVPYDQLVRDLITATGTWTSQPEANFITVTIDQNQKTGPDEMKLAARTTRAFLGLRLDCVQCHDDMFGPRWKQTHFHQLASFYGPADMELTGVRDGKKPYTYEFSKTKGLEEVEASVPFLEELRPKTGPLREQLATWVTHEENPAFARAAVNRFWALLVGVPMVEPVDSVPLDGPYPPGMEILADDFVRNGHDLQRLIRIIANTRAFQLSSSANQHEPNLVYFPMSRLRPEQVAGALIQSANLNAIDHKAPFIVQMSRGGQTKEFVARFGDLGQDEFTKDGGTIPQRLLLMNGKLVNEKTKDDLVGNASTRIAALAPDDEAAVQAVYLAALTRRPNQPERNYFSAILKGKKGKERNQRLGDIYWSLINSTEFSWNH